MPELPEVETVVRTLRPTVVGRFITAVHLHRLDILTPAGTDLPPLLLGRSVRSIDRRGKKILFTLGDAHLFCIHLGMTGQLTLDPPDAPLRPHTHLALDLSDSPLQLRFRDPRRFGGLWWLGCDDPGDAEMGPEPLTLRWQTLAARLATTRRAVKTALLDQRVIAGIGNIYADEALFLAAIHPQTPADRLSAEQAKRLNAAIKSTLNKAIRHRGSTLRDYRDANNEAGGFQRLHCVYDRKGQPCPACRTPIERIVLGGRSTHFCPKCQPPVG